jgi:hypothetical protein
MSDKQTDAGVLGRIKDLVEEEHTLRSEQNPADDRVRRLESIRIELDQCWDLLRQRRALREFGRNADDAAVRSPQIVENYEQ